MSAPATTAWPGLGFDPAPGDPAGATGLSRQLAETARRLQETHAVLAQVREQRGTWTGEASRTFAAKMEALPGYLDSAQRSLRCAGGVLDEWRGRLGGLQGRARDLETRAADTRTRLLGAEDAEQRARSHPDLSLIGRMFGTDPELDEANRRIAAAQGEVDRAVRLAAGLRASLEDLLRQGRALSTEHADEARRTADAIRKADDGLAPPEPAWFEQAVDWFVENAGTIGDYAGLVSSVASTLALIPAVAPIAGPIALIASGVALFAHSTDMVHNDRWAEPDAWVELAGDAAGLVPGVKALGEASAAVSSGSGGFLTRSLAGAQAFGAKVSDAGPLATMFADGIAPNLGTAGREAVARSVDGLFNVGTQAPSVVELSGGAVDDTLKAQVEGSIPAKGVTDLGLGALARAAA